MSLQLQSPTGALGVCCIAQGYLGGPGNAFYYQNTSQDWGLNWEASASQLSLLQTELAPLHLSLF